MKRFFITYLIVLLGFSITFAQGTNSIAITLISQISVLDQENSGQQKLFEFTLSGLQSEADINQFTEKIKNYRGVISFDINDNGEGNLITATAIFYSYANKKYLCNLMKYCDVSIINYNNKSFTLEEFTNIKSPDK